MVGACNWHSYDHLVGDRHSASGFPNRLLAASHAKRGRDSIAIQDDVSGTTSRSLLLGVYQPTAQAMRNLN